MIRAPTTAPNVAPDASPERPATYRGLLLGLLAGLAVADVYGLLSEPFELTLGLIVVGIVGGWVIGGAISRGAWAGREHPPVRRLQEASVVIAFLAWIVALLIAYSVSQALIPQASTPLAERLSLSGLLDYVAGLDIVRFIHVISLALMAFMAWRGAR